MTAAPALRQSRILQKKKMAGRMTRHFKHIVCRIKLFGDNFELECSLDILVAFYGSLVNAGLLYSV